MRLTRAANCPGESLDSMAPKVPKGSDRASERTRCRMRPRWLSAAIAAVCARCVATAASFCRVPSVTSASWKDSDSVANCW